MRGTATSYGHHSPSNYHYGQIPTLDNVEYYFWLPNIQKDIRDYVNTCIICQFAKRSPIKKQQMRIRDLLNVREQTMADYMGPFFKRYYILVLIDDGSGNTVLVPTDNCASIVTADSISTHWVPYFGWFTIFESYLGSCFKSVMTELLMKAMDVKQNFAEPRYHQSIGKVERVIRVIQTGLRTFNIEFENKFVTRCDSSVNWDTIKSIIPLIQFSINRKRSRISTLSAATLMLGDQINDVPDISIAIENLKNGLKENKFHKDKHLYLEKIQNI